MEEERGMGMGPVEVDRPEPVLRATGGSEEPLSISDTGERTWVYCWEEATAFEKKKKKGPFVSVTLNRGSQVAWSGQRPSILALG